MIPISDVRVTTAGAAEVQEILQAGRLASGPVTERFEREFAEWIGVPHAAAVTNGTVALELALRCLGVRPGDEVVTTPFTFVATANAIVSLGARPVFADISESTYNIDPDACAVARTSKTRVVLPVHLFGLPADIPLIRERLGPNSPRVLEDAAQAHGAHIDGLPVGALGDAAIFSLYATKNIHSGEGGMVTTRSPETDSSIRTMRNHGRSPTAGALYAHESWGTNARLSDLHSAVGRDQLRQADIFAEKRRTNASLFSKALEGHEFLNPPTTPTGSTHAYHQYTIRTESREQFVEHMRSKGIGTGVYYPQVCYAYPHLQAFASSCPVAEQAARQVVSIPVHPYLEPAQLDEICAALDSFRPRPK